VDYLILFPAGMTKAEAVRQVEPNRAEDGSGEDEEPWRRSRSGFFTPKALYSKAQG